MFNKGLMSIFCYLLFWSNAIMCKNDKTILSDFRNYSNARYLQSNIYLKFKKKYAYTSQIKKCIHS